MIDPIDGSLNARRTLPSFALSVAVASGPSMADVEFGFVHDFGAGEEFVAARGPAPPSTARSCSPRGPGYGLEVVGLEATKPELILPVVAGLQGQRLPAAAASARSRSPSATSPPGASTACSAPARAARSTSPPRS